MNRIATRHEDIALELESRLTLDFEAAPTRRLESRLTTYIPLHYESGYAYPLIVWLPGNGASEDQLAEVMPAISLRNYIGVGIRGPLAGVRGAELPQSWDLSLDGIAAAAEAVAGSVESLRSRFNIAPDRVFLAGYADGGTMAVNVALAAADQFAGVATLGGAFPRGGAPLSDLKQVRQLELLLAHGRTSEAYTEEEVCDDLRLVHYAGINVTLRQYPHGQELSQNMLADLNRWAMQIVTGHVEEPSVTMPFELN